MRFHHLGFFCRSIEIGLTHFQGIHQITDISKVYRDVQLGVEVQFFIVDGFLRYELVAPFGKKNPVDGVLDSKKNILNHVGYITDDFDKEVISLREKKHMVIAGPKPALAFGNKRVIFFLTPLGYIIEVIENMS